MFDLVRSYAEQGDHRTGTPVDTACRSWLVGILTAGGASVAEQTYDFDQWVGKASLVCDGRALPDVMPLSWSFEGSIDTTNVAVEEVDLLASVNPAHADAGASDATVLVTTTGYGRLVGHNVMTPVIAGPPTVLASESYLEELRSASSLRISAQGGVQPGQSANVIATRGEAPYLLIATPLTGWFRCAGERGTGIAIALALAKELAKDLPVMFLGTTSHELGYDGMRRFLAAHSTPPVAAVHVGACAAAAGESVAALSEFVQVATRDDSIVRALATTGHQVAVKADDKDWRGEAGLLAPLGTPLISVAGYSPLFHTPDDLPDAATSPALLEQVYAGLLEAVRLAISLQ